MSEPEIELHTKIETPDSKGLSAVRELIVHQSVLDAMAGHVSADTTVEHGGVMLGSVDDKTGAVTITGSIAAVGAVSRVASLTFTHETWDHISEVQERSFPDTKMVGWYHSHPHFGIFLSDHDLFIHRNFFKEPWQVAYVIDPLLHQEGFFVWEDGDVARLPKWQVISDGGTPQGHLGVQEPARGMVPPPPPKKSGGIVLGTIAIALVALLVGGAAGYLIGTSGSSEAAPVERAIPPAPVNVWRVDPDGETPLSYPAAQITAAGGTVWCVGPDGYWQVEPPNAAPPQLRGSQAIEGGLGGTVWAVVRDETGLTVHLGKRSARLNDDAGTPIITASATIVRAWVRAGSSIIRVEPGNTSTSFKTIAVSIQTPPEPSESIGAGAGPDANGDQAGLADGQQNPTRPVIQDLAAWGQEVVALADGTIYVQENDQRLRPEEGPGVLEVAASGDDLWYLTENTHGRVLHHRSKAGTPTWQMQVGPDARIAAAPGYVWVTESLEGTLARVSGDGDIRTTNQLGPPEDLLAATQDSLFALTKRTTLDGGTVAWEFRMDSSPTVVETAVPATTSTSTTTTTRTSQPGSDPDRKRRAGGGEHEGGK